MHTTTLNKKPIDLLGRREALQAMVSSHEAAVRAVSRALPAIDAAAALVAKALSGNATLHYVAAGSSGLMALSDASELPGTFGTDPSQINIVMAGGVPTDGIMPGDTEDDEATARTAADQAQSGDVAIVISASGTTPFAISFATRAAANGVKIIAIANAPDTPLLALGDVAVSIPTDAEVVAGSTRLGAGTAQKVALNMISTQAGILMGHVHDGLMVNLKPDNIKLRKRAAAIVTEISGASEAQATDALAACNYDTKQAVLVALGTAPDEAKSILLRHDGHLRPTITSLKSKD